MDIGNRIAALRKKLRLTQEELAEKCGWNDRQRISHYEKNRNYPKIWDIKKLAKALKTTTYYLMYGNEQINKASQFFLRLSENYIDELLGYPLVLGAKQSDSLLIDPLRKPKNNDYVIVKYKKTDELLFKQYIVENSKSYLKSLDPNQPILSLNAEIEIIGVVTEYHSILI